MSTIITSLLHKYTEKELLALSEGMINEILNVER